MTTTRVYLAQILLSDDEEVGLYSVLEEYRDTNVGTRRVWGPIDVMWMLANVKSADHSTMLMDTRLTPLPDVAPTALVADFSSNDAMTILSALSYHGVPATVLTSATTFRDVVHGIGQHLLGQPWDVVSFFAL